MDNRKCIYFVEGVFDNSFKLFTSSLYSHRSPASLLILSSTENPLPLYLA